MMQIFPVFDDSHHQLLANFEKNSVNSSGTSPNSPNNVSSPVGPPSNAASPTPHSKTGLSTGDQHTSSTGSLTNQQQAQLQAHRNSIALYSKSISTSAKDQQYFLTLDELHSKDYTYSSKIVIFTTNAIAKLSKEQFLVSCLAITGLTKLAAKNATDIVIDDRIVPARSDKTAGIPNKMLRKRSSFMVAANSLSESSEERLLTEIKLELNKNSWSKLSSFGEVLGANFKRGNDSMSQMQVHQTSHSKLGTSGSKSNLGSDHQHQLHHHGLGSSQSKTNLSASPPLDSKDAAMAAGMAGLHISASPNVDNRRKSLKESPPPNNKSDFQTPVKEHHTSLRDATSPTHVHSHGIAELDNHEKDGMMKRHSQSSSTAPHAHTQDHHSISGQAHQQQLHHDHSHQSLSRVASPSAEVKSNATMPQSPTPPIDNNQSQNRRKPSLTTIKRATSLKLNSEADYLKSKKIAANTVSQLLLDWLETRQDPLFATPVVEKLAKLWRLHGIALWIFVL